MALKRERKDLLECALRSWRRDWELFWRPSAMRWTKFSTKTTQFGRDFTAICDMSVIHRHINHTCTFADIVKYCTKSINLVLLQASTSPHLPLLPSVSLPSSFSAHFSFSFLFLSFSLLPPVYLLDYKQTKKSGSKPTLRFWGPMTRIIPISVLTSVRRTIVFSFTATRTISILLCISYTWLSYFYLTTHCHSGSSWLGTVYPSNTVNSCSCLEKISMAPAQDDTLSRSGTVVDLHWIYIYSFLLFLNVYLFEQDTFG